MFMNDFKKDFELRRIIFGLVNIFGCNQLPDLVNQKLPDVMNQIALLASKMHSERLETMKDNEKYIARGGKDSDEESDDEEGGTSL